MKLGIFSKTYETHSIDETFKRMSRDGLYCTNLNFANAGMPVLPEVFDASAVKHIADSAAACGISIPSVTGTFNMIDPDKKARMSGIAQFRNHCIMAGVLGIPVVSLCTGSKNPESKWKWHNDNLLPESYRELMLTTEFLLEYAEEGNVVLGVEPEVSNIINTPCKALQYLKDAASDRLKIIIDGANLFTAENAGKMRDVLDETFDLLGEHIVLAHAKDLSLKDGVSFVAAGEGELDYPYYISLLKQAGYDGALVMHGLNEEQVARSRDFLLQLM